MIELKNTLDFLVGIEHLVESEDSVRESLLLPILASLGYSIGGVYQIVLGVKYKRTPLNACIYSERHYLYPDIILEVNDRRVWIVEVKRRGENPSRQRNLLQLKSYLTSDEKGCRWGVITNGLIWELYCLTETGMKRIDRFNLKEIRHQEERATAFFHYFSPASAFLRRVEIEEILQIYMKGNWIVRNICMDVLRRRPLNERRKLRDNVVRWQEGKSTRERSLPAIMFSDDDALIAQISMGALNDVTDTVRDTFFTIVRSLAHSSPGYRVNFDAYSCVPDGWFSRALYLQMLSALLSGDAVKAGRDRERIFSLIAKFARHTEDDVVREFANIAMKGIYTPFPFTVFSNRPKTYSFQKEIDSLFVRSTVRLLRDSNYNYQSRNSAQDALLHSKLPRAYISDIVRPEDALRIVPLIGKMKQGAG